METVKRYIFYFFTFAFLGWIWEIILNFIYEHKFINPGTMLGPWVPIYGFGMIFIILISKKINNNYLLFIISFFLCGTIEYLTSLYLEFFYNVKWWDYSEYLLNINGRISVEGLTIFSSLAVILINFIIPKLDNIYNKINKNSFTVVLTILMILYGTDFIYSTFHPNINDTVSIAKNLKVFN